MDADRFKSNAMLETAIGLYQEVLGLPDVPKTLLILSGRKCSERQAFRGESPAIYFIKLQCPFVCMCVSVCTRHLYINLRRSRDGSFVLSAGRTDGVPSSKRPSVGFIQFALASYYADCPHKRII